MIIGTWCFSQSARSWSSRLFDRCTIWFTANGADIRWECALPCAPGSSWIGTSHSSSSAGGRAFNAGNDPTIPALHCAITSSGTEMMNSGAPITGKDRRPLNKAGMDIRKNPFRYLGQDPRQASGIGLKMPDIIPTRQSCIRRRPLLAQRAGNVIFGPAVARLALAARQGHFFGAFFDRLGVKALALLEAPRLTELVGVRLAVPRAIGRHRTYHARRHHR